jgi:hypothetical protein
MHIFLEIYPSVQLLGTSSRDTSQINSPIPLFTRTVPVDIGRMEASFNKYFNSDAGMITSASAFLLQPAVFNLVTHVHAELNCT